MPLLEDLRGRRRRPGRAGAPTAAAPPQPPADHHPAIATRPAAATARVEPLGDAAHRCAPGDVLVKALLGFLGDPDPLPASLLAEPRSEERRVGKECRSR